MPNLRRMSLIVNSDKLEQLLLILFSATNKYLRITTLFCLFLFMIMLKNNNKLEDY